MSENHRTLYFDQKVNVPTTVVYHAFINSTILKQFFCNYATVDAKPGGRIYFAWDNGYSLMGEYTRLEENHAIGFLWQGRDDPGTTQVEITLDAVGGGTLVHLSHGGIGDGEAWDESIQEFTKGWNQALENLSSVLETGEDIRFVRRPMMGILYAEFNAEIAKELGVPVTEGVRLGGVADGLSAQSAGLKKDDVMISLSSTEVKEWTDLGLILQRRRAGDQIEVVFYRGTERKEVTMTLSKRPLPEIPWKISGLAAAVEKHYTTSAAQVDKLLKDVSEEEASQKLGEGEWNIKEVLAHLLNSERNSQNGIQEMVGSQESWADSYHDSEWVIIQALVKAYPTMQLLLAELKRNYQINVDMVAALPEDFPTRLKGNYWHLAYGFLQPDYHLIDHLDQIGNCIKKARSEK